MATESETGEPVRLRLRRWAVAVITLVGCGGGPVPGVPPVTSLSPSPSPVSDTTRFDVAVLVDASGRQPERGEIDRAVAKADARLRERTGVGMNVLEVAYAVPRGTGVVGMATDFLAPRAVRPPAGLIVLLNDANSTTYGGYALNVRPPFPYLSPFPSPVSAVGSGRVYVAVMHFDHFYARCGYDDQQQRVSNVSFGGECRGRDGLACVPRPGGEYWTCPDTLDDLYSDWDYFKGCTIVHEFMHSFGSEGNHDHYGAASCMARGALTAAQAADRRLGQEFCQVCPDVYPRFKRN